MTSLEPIVTIGDIDVAAVVEIERFPVTGGGRRYLAGVSASMSKRPVAVILKIDETIRAFTRDGHALSMVDFDAAFPGLRSQFEHETRH